MPAPPTTTTGAAIRTPTTRAAARPAQVHLSGIYVDRVVLGTFEKRIEKRTVAGASGKPVDAMREKIIRRAAKELKDGMCGSLVSHRIPPDPT